MTNPPEFKISSPRLRLRAKHGRHVFTSQDAALRIVSVQIVFCSIIAFHEKENGRAPLAHLAAVEVDSHFQHPN
jgi:hypothetical protein